MSLRASDKSRNVGGNHIMRISGSYLDRLLIKWLPIVILPWSLVLIIMGAPPEVALYITITKGFIIAFILWAFDTLLLVQKRIKSIYLKNGIIKIGSQEISPDDILSIRTVVDKRIGWNIKTLEVEFLVNDSIQRARFITKPVLLNFRKNSRTLSILEENYPFLKSRFDLESTE